MENLVSERARQEAKRHLSALGYPEMLVGKVCLISVEDHNRQVQTFVGVEITDCYLRKECNCEELVVKINRQTHRGAAFDTITRNVGPKAGGKTNWWVSTMNATSGRTESWKIIGLIPS